MSMNIHISGVGDAIYPNGKKYPNSESFGALQTPTSATNKILSSEDKIGEYKKWVMEIHGADSQEEILDYEGWNEKTNYYPVVGYKTVNFGREHCEELDRFVEQIKEKGLCLEFYSF